MSIFPQPKVMFFSVKEQIQKFSDDYITTLEKMYRLKEKDLLKV